MQTAATHAATLRQVADHVDPNTPTVLDPDDHAEAAQQLRDAAQHLERIATGGDAKASDEAARGG